MVEVVGGQAGDPLLEDQDLKLENKHNSCRLRIRLLLDHPLLNTLFRENIYIDRFQPYKCYCYSGSILDRRLYRLLLDINYCYL